MNLLEIDDLKSSIFFEKLTGILFLFIIPKELERRVLCY
jgi:hypothetical protein